MPTARRPTHMTLQQSAWLRANLRQQLVPLRIALTVSAPQTQSAFMTKASSVPPVQREGTCAGPNPDALVSIRSDVLRFTALHVGNREAVEDMVQEAMEAGLRHLQGFRGQSSFKTWIFASLENKTIDHLRPSTRTVNSSSLTNYADQDGELDVDALFDERGGWRNGPRPVAWPSPDDAMQSRQFWIVSETCLALLALKAGKVFMMREFLGFESEESCLQLDLTTSKPHVMHLRSRLKLRGCLENGWVDPGAAAC